MDLVWIWRVEVSLRIPEVTMAPGKPALAPALPCLAVCAIWSLTLSLYAFLVFDPQVNDPNYFQSLSLPDANFVRDASIMRAQDGALHA